MRELLACLCTELGEAGWEGTCCVRAGEVAWDSCCEDGGMAWARLISVFPTDRFPFQGSPVDLSRTEAEWAARIELGAVTCVGSVAGCDEAGTEAVLGMGEAALRSLLCCASEGQICSDLRVGGLNITGPHGGCGGFTIEVWVALGVCCDDSACE